MTKARERLYTFLRDKSQYNAAYLMDKIKNSWMFEELILLLLKEKKYDEAIKKYVDKEKF